MPSNGAARPTNCVTRMNGGDAGQSYGSLIHIVAVELEIALWIALVAIPQAKLEPDHSL